MSYTQHEWENGEVITAAKLNNIEEGIVEAASSGGGTPIINMTFSGFATYSHLLYFYLCTMDDGAYVPVTILGSSIEGFEIYAYANNGGVITHLPPTSGDYYLVFKEDSGNEEYTFTGDIDSEGSTLISGGVNSVGHVIRGNCTINVINVQ